MPVNNLKRLGYGGSAVVDGVQVLVTSGSVDVSKTPAYTSPLDITPSAVPRSKVLHADGTEAYSMNLGLDVTQNFLDILTTSKLFKRRYEFTMAFNDGETVKGLTNCFVTSLTVSGAAGGLMTATLAVVSASAPSTPLVANAYIGFQGNTGWSSNNFPMGYWYSGNTNVKDWSLTMTQEANPVYLNQDVMTPQYIKVGLVSYSLQVTTYEQWYAPGYTPPDPNVGTDTIKISTSSFTLHGNVTGENATYNGPSELGGYVHTFESAARTNYLSSDTIIT
jgi:hypothetical protein